MYLGDTRHPPNTLLEINMKKRINSIFSSSLFILLFSITMIVGAQLIIYKYPELPTPIETRTEHEQFIKNTQDINLLRGAALLLFEGNNEYEEFLIDTMSFTRNIFILLGLFAAAIVFQAFKAKKEISNNAINADNHDHQPK